MNLKKYEVSFTESFKKFVTPENLKEIEQLFQELKNMYSYLEYIYFTHLDEEEHIKCNKKLKELVQQYYDNKLFNIFVKVFKPFGSKPWSLAENFLTLDEKFMVRYYNGFWYCLPITDINILGIITTKVPNDLIDEHVKAYDSQQICMLAHVIERMKLCLEENK